MRYVLGIHLGGTRVTAALCRHRDGRWGGPEVIPLGAGAPWTDAVLHVSGEGDLVVGQAAWHMAGSQPDQVIRAPLHRTGDPAPFVLGGLSYPAETLAAGMIGWVTDRVAEIEAAQAERIVVTHPPHWTTYRRALLHDALDQAALPGVLALPSPIAAAESYATGTAATTAGADGASGPSGVEGPGEADGTGEVPVGKLLGVCMLGGTGARAAVLRRAPRGFELLAHAESDAREAGGAFDDLLVDHVLPHTGIDGTDPAATARLRVACAAAKERLSHVPEAAVTDTVSVTREEFEELVRPALTAAVGRLRRLTAQFPADEFASVVLVGGSARIPLAGQLARTMLSTPVAVDDDPGSALCRGAALAARPRPAPPEPGPAEGAPDPAGWDTPAPPVEAGRADSGALVPRVPQPPAPPAADDPDPEPPPSRPPVEITPLEPPRQRFSFARKSSSTTDRDEER